MFDSPRVVLLTSKGTGLADTSRLDRLRRRARAAGLDIGADLAAHIGRVEAALGRREVERQSLDRQIEILQGCITELEAERQVIDHELAGYEKTVEALLEDALATAGIGWSELWSPTPIIGFRGWIMRENGLHGAKIRWTSRRLTARCLNIGATADEVPHSDGECGSPPCGIYATKELGSLVEYFGDSAKGGRAFGVVALSGRVVDHETGYRAAAAEVLALSVVDGTGLLTTCTPDEIDEVFTSNRDEVRGHTTPTSHPMEKAIEFLGEQARRHDQCTLASN